jgi:hypothetical protein
MSPSLHRTRSHVCHISAALAALLLPGVISSAESDLKITSDVTVSGAPGSARNQTQKVVTYYKGNVIRTETGKGVSLYDAKTQSVTTIDPEKKTYRVVSLKEGFAGSSGMLSKLELSATADIAPKGETKMIAGRKAAKYAGKATISMSIKGVSSQPSRQTVMEIEQWAAESVRLPASLNAANPFFQLAGPLQNMKGMEPLMKALARVTGTPLSSRISVRAGANGVSRDPVVTTTNVVALSETPLPADLFKVPSGYRKLETTAFPVPPKGLGSADPHGH